MVVQNSNCSGTVLQNVRRSHRMKSQHYFCGYVKSQVYKNNLQSISAKISLKI